LGIRDWSPTLQAAGPHTRTAELPGGHRGVAVDRAQPDGDQFPAVARDRHPTHACTASCILRAYEKRAGNEVRVNGHDRLGRAWLILTLGLACHVLDEALTGFLDVYNPIVRSARARFGWFPMRNSRSVYGWSVCVCSSPYCSRFRRLPTAARVLSGSRRIRMPQSCC
jgi:hypothetical protein